MTLSCTRPSRPPSGAGESVDGSAGPSRTPRSEGLIGDASTEMSTWDPVGSGIGSSISRSCSAPSEVIVDRSVLQVSGMTSIITARLDKKKWTKCKSPRIVKLKLGKPILRVRGIATDGTFGKPIVRKVKRIR